MILEAIAVFSALIVLLYAYVECFRRYDIGFIPAVLLIVLGLTLYTTGLQLPTSSTTAKQVNEISTSETIANTTTTNSTTTVNETTEPSYIIFPDVLGYPAGEFFGLILIIVGMYSTASYLSLYLK